MFEFERIKFDTIFLTRDTLSSGDKAWSQVAGLDLLYVGEGGKTERNADGSLLNFLSPIVDAPVDIDLEWADVDTLDSVNAVVAQYRADGLSFDCEIVSEIGTFTGQAKFRWEPLPIEIGVRRIKDGSKSYVDDVTIRISITLDEE